MNDLAARYPCSVHDAMDHWPTGVAVVTTADRDGWWWGFTADSFTAVSRRPPLISVGLDRQAPCRSAFTTADAYAVHVLRAGQEQLSERFAGGTSDNFDGLRVECGFEDVPLLADVTMRIECRAANVLPAGDHVLLLGEVVRIRTGPGDPLVHLGQSYRQLSRPLRAHAA